MDWRPDRSYSPDRSILFLVLISLGLVQSRSLAGPRTEPQNTRTNPWEEFVTLMNMLHQEKPHLLICTNEHKLVPISKVQADFDLLLNNKLELVFLSGRQADLDLFLW